VKSEKKRPRICGKETRMNPPGLRCYGEVVHVCTNDGGHTGPCECGCGVEFDGDEL
jgi:hypothetical protein